MPGAENSGRPATRTTMPRSLSLRAANSNVSAEDRSSQCASSARHSTGPARDTSVSSVTVAMPTRKRLSAACVPEPPSAASSASRSRSGSASTLSSAADSSSCSPANGSSASLWIPVHRKTRHLSSTEFAASSSSADFPAPGSAVMNRAPPRPSWALFSSARICVCSSTRPCSIRQTMACRSARGQGRWWGLHRRCSTWLVTPATRTGDRAG